MKRKFETVGEMVANLHWRDAAEVARKDAKEFQDTDVGRALLAFENTHFRVVQCDCQEHISDKSLRVAWDRFDEAHRTLVTHIKRLMESARQRDEGVK